MEGEFGDLDRYRKIQNSIYPQDKKRKKFELRYFSKKEIHFEYLDEDYDINLVKAHFQDFKSLADFVGVNISMSIKLSWQEKIKKFFVYDTIKDIKKIKKEIGYDVWNYFDSCNLQWLAAEYIDCIEKNSAEEIFEKYVGKLKTAHKIFEELVKLDFDLHRDVICGRYGDKMYSIREITENENEKIYDANLVKMINRESFDENLFNTYVIYLNEWRNLRSDLEKLREGKDFDYYKDIQPLIKKYNHIVESPHVDMFNKSFYRKSITSA